MQDNYWSRLDEHWNEINCLECCGRTNQGMGTVSAQKQQACNAFYKVGRREYSLVPPPLKHKFPKGINKNKPTVFANRNLVTKNGVGTLFMLLNRPEVGLIRLQILGFLTRRPLLIRLFY